ncbi:hypothetical protein PLICRDRAFT_53535 [Plicaturopsis crispa FD-325 SS-3]|nr:hypothetical protein PLICRDRAFT_53535 [Plicaturopsis crispa FD-325 SS-3]
MSQADANKAHDDAVNGVAEKHSLVELKNGKVVFKQKSVSFEKQSETLQEIVKFREMIEERVQRQDPPLTAIPDEHRAVIAKLAHESDKSLSALAKHIRQELLPAQDEDDETGAIAAAAALPHGIVESTLRSIMSRNNYGIEAAPGGHKVPAALCVWRWEVKEEYRDWLPKSAKDKAEARLADRLQAKRDLAALVDALPEEERHALLDPKGAAKHHAKEPVKSASADTSASAPMDLTGDEPESSSQPSKRQGKKKADESENDTPGENAKGSTSRKKLTDSEKAAKEKEKREKEEKRAAKAEKERVKAEKEQKAKDAQIKSRSLMANFFGKKSAPTPRTSPTKVESAGPTAGPSNATPEFQKVFKPFVLKKDAELAPINWFVHAKRRRTHALDGDVIVIDGDEVEKAERIDIDMEDVQEDVRNLDERARLRSILATLPPSPSRRRSQQATSTTRALMNQLTEAEIAGDDALVRTLLTTLRSRSALPAKVLIFTEDARPGYFGTWTRTSRTIRPRAPFARDVIERDYAYDSGEEWEDEAPEGADDVVEDAEDEDGAGEDADSDLDSWLVDDDEVLEEGEAGSPISPDDLRSSMPPPPAPLKRKAEDERKIGKKRKVVVPLVPFAKGPCWETRVGQCEYDAFKPYRIQVFNDTPFPIDPFTFVSTVLEDCKHKSAPSAAPSKFAVPPVPERVAQNISNQAQPLAPPNGASGPIKPRASVPAPKTTFPAAHLPLLLEKITTLATGNITFIIETVYAELQRIRAPDEKAVKKNAVEAKVREVGMKCKDRKVWVVKEGFGVGQVSAP